MMLFYNLQYRYLGFSVPVFPHALSTWTNAGLEKAKSLLVVKDGKTFIDLIAEQVSVGGESE